MDASSDASIMLVLPRVDARAHDSSRPDASSPAEASPPVNDAARDALSLLDASPDAVGDTGPGNIDSSFSCVGQPDGAFCGNGSDFAECCGGLCSNLGQDSSNCGQCGNVCQSGYYCNGAECVVTECGPGYDNMTCVYESFVGETLTAAFGTCCGSSCTELASDPGNCGSCGKACVATSTCTGGSCSAPTTCAPANSGAACPLPDGGTGTCCSSVCVTGFESSTAHCGVCGAACPTGESCVDGLCMPPDGGTGACATGTIRDAVGSCVLAACPAGVSGVACLFGNVGREGYNDVVDGLCCDGVCTNPTGDANNCGACGVVCASGACATGFFGEPAGCVPGVSTPPQFTVCAAPNLWVTTALGFGQCISPGCSGPGGYCVVRGGVGLCLQEGFGFTNTCIDVANDPSNCGAQYVTCPSGQTCTAGVCSGSVAPCNSGGQNGAYCNLGTSGTGTSELCCAGGGCTDVLTDPANCGTCGNLCPSNLSCIAGLCEAASCTGQTNGTGCGAGGTNECCGGTCVDSQTDPSNCGSCGAHCSGAETCAGGRCGFDTCTLALQGDPCHLPASEEWDTGDCCGASCVDITTDSANCGGCNLPCATGTTCTNGACQ